MSRFTDAMSAVNAATGEMMGEPFIVAGVTYNALDVGELSQSERLTGGGTYKPGTLKITVNKDVLKATGLGMNKRLQARGAELRVDFLIDEGDDAPILICGPAGVSAKP